jgi:hypothetical protein
MKQRINRSWTVVLTVAVMLCFTVIYLESVYKCQFFSSVIPRLDRGIQCFQ